MDAYAKAHRDRVNLAIHLVMVPVFVLGVVALGIGAVRLDVLVLGCGAAALGVSLAFQGYGHKREATPPDPFAGPGDFVKRILREQLVTFPRYVLTGGWLRAWRASIPRP